MLVQLLWNYCSLMYADGGSLEAHPDPNSHSMLLALRIITENDGLVFDSCSIQCFHELLLVRGLRTTYLYAEGAVRHSAKPCDVEAAFL
mgnify:CR=1 FL=1